MQDEMNRREWFASLIAAVAWCCGARPKVDLWPRILGTQKRVTGIVVPNRYRITVNKSLEVVKLFAPTLLFGEVRRWRR